MAILCSLQSLCDIAVQHSYNNNTKYMTSLTYINKAYVFVQETILFAKNNYTTKEPLSSIRSCGDNFIYDSEYRYYLSQHHLYKNIKNVIIRNNNYIYLS